MSYNPKVHHRRSIRLKGYDYTRPGDYFITICTHNQSCRFGCVVEAFSKHLVTSDGRHIRFDAGGVLESRRAASVEIGDPHVMDTDDNNAWMELNELGQIAYDEWLKLPERFANCQLGVFQIMPNHMHGIIRLADNRVPVADIPVSDAPVADAPVDAAVDAPVGTSLADVPIADVPIADVPIADDDWYNNDDWYSEVRSDDRRGGDGAARGATARVARTGDIVGAYKSLVFNGCLDVFKARNEMMGKLWLRNYYEHIIRDRKSYERISHYIINNPRKWRNDRFFL